MEDVLISTARKSCNLCHARKALKQSTKDMDIARKALKDLYDFYIEQFNVLRGTDTPTEIVVKAKDNKNLCLDVMDECKNCSKDIDIINQRLRELSR